MGKPTIAIDIDDVLADSTESLRLVVNKHSGVDLQPDHYKVPGDGYHGYYAKVWAKHGVDVTLEELSSKMAVDQSHVQPYEDARQVLAELGKQYRLVVVTARNADWKPATLRWLEVHFPDVFSEVVFLTESEEPYKTKGELCKVLGASWLVDDNVEHAESALAEGIKVVLFGTYGWHHNVPDGVVRCKDWQVVREYFDGAS